MPSAAVFGPRTFLSDMHPLEAPSSRLGGSPSRVQRAGKVQDEQQRGADLEEGLEKDGGTENEPVQPPAAAAALHDNDGEDQGREGVREGEREGLHEKEEGGGILQPPSSIQAQRDSADVAERESDSEGSSAEPASASEEGQECEEGGRARGVRCCQLL